MDVILIETCTENAGREGMLITQDCRQQGHKESTGL